MKIGAALLVLLMCSSPSGIYIREMVTVTIPNGFLRGQDFLEMSEIEKNSYVIGYINGLTVAPVMGANPEYFEWLEETVLDPTLTNLNYIQIITEYIENNPEAQGRGLNLVTFRALETAFSSNV
jgi:hypothetical protein